MLVRTTLILLALFFYSYCCAQNYEEKNFRHFTTQDGLSTNYITGIEQDAYGYIWIATYKGLNRFDGNSFQQFHSDSSRNSLPQEMIIKLKWLDEENLGAMTFTGLHIMNTRTLQSRNITIPQPASKKLNEISKISDAVTDKRGNLFISTFTGFYQFNNKDELVFRFDYPLSNHKSKAVAFGWNIIKTEDDVLLLSTFDQPYIYYVAQKDLHPVGESDKAFYRQITASGNLMAPIRSRYNSSKAVIPNENEFVLADMRKKTRYSIKAPFKVQDVFDAGGGLTMLSVNDSTFAFNSKELGFYLIHYNTVNKTYFVSPKVCFPNYFCTSLLMDRNNRLWVGTNDGLLYEKKSVGKIEQITLEQSAIRNYFLTIAVSNNKTFLGTSRDGLIVLKRDNLKQIKQFDFSGYKTNKRPNIIYCSALIHPDTLFTGTAGIWVNTRNLTNGIIKLAHLDSTYDGVDLLFKDSHYNIYLKKAQGNVFFFRGKDGKFRKLDYEKELSDFGRIQHLAEDAEGNIWFAGDGMKRFNFRLQRFDLVLDSFPFIKNPEKGISSNIVFDRMGRMYFGIWQNGVVIYDPGQKKFSEISRRNGLPDDVVRSLYLHNNVLWIGTESGLASYDLSTKNVFSFGAADGIPTNPFPSYLLCYDSAHQQLYGAFRNTLFRFNPDSLRKNNSPPQFSIESIGVSGRETIYHPGDKVDLSYNDNNVVITMAAANFEDAYNQQFAYRLLKDGNEAWQDIGSQRSIIFSNLSAATHRLQVKVYTRDGSWPQQVKEIIIVVHPPVWRTVWFLTCCVLLFTGTLVVLYKRRIKQIKQRANLDSLLAQTEMKALHAQMNPHFIFNCLNSIREMILNNENQQASHYLSKFAHLIRITLDNSTKSFISLQNTIDYLKRYLEMEKIRTENFNYSLEIDENLDPEEIFLPPMLIQPFIENSIWHGQKPDEIMKLSIRFLKRNNELVCTIEDNGIGIEASLKAKEKIKHQSLGIANIQQRIHLLNEKYDLKSNVFIEDKSTMLPKNGTGTKVTLRLPEKNIES